MRLGYCFDGTARRPASHRRSWPSGPGSVGAPSPTWSVGYTARPTPPQRAGSAHALGLDATARAALLSAGRGCGGRLARDSHREPSAAQAAQQLHWSPAGAGRPAPVARRQPAGDADGARRGRARRAWHSRLRGRPRRRPSSWTWRRSNAKPSSPRPWPPRSASIASAAVDLLAAMARALVRPERSARAGQLRAHGRACAELAERLLADVRRCRSWPPSRERFGIAGEAVWPVAHWRCRTPPNACSPETLAEVPAVRLFIERARRAVCPISG